MCTIFNTVSREAVSLGDVRTVLKELREQPIGQCVGRGAHAEGAAEAKALGWKLFGEERRGQGSWSTGSKGNNDRGGHGELERRGLG